jgi:hypothetical protein
MNSSTRGRVSGGSGFARKILDAALNGGELGGVAEHEQDGVVAGDAAEDFGPLLPVECFGDRLSAAGEGLDDEEVAGPFGADEESGQEPVQRRLVVECFGRERVVETAVGGGDLDESQLADIARERGLGDVEAATVQHLAELFLAADPVRLDQLANDGVSGGLSHARECRRGAAVVKTTRLRRGKQAERPGGGAARFPCDARSRLAHWLAAGTPRRLR